MRVRYLSGHLAGCEQDLPQVEAEVAIATGYAELAPESSAAEPSAVEDAPTTDPPPADPQTTENPPTPDPTSE
jgi:hypothetical protein